MTPSGRGERLVALAYRYLSNAGELADRGEYEKAGEILWGTVVLAAKAHAGARGHRVQKYRAVADYVFALAREQSEPALMAGFHAAEALHGRFYEGLVSADGYAASFAAIEVLLAELLPDA